MDWLDVHQAAEFLELSEQRVRQLAKDGRIGMKVGYRWLFNRAKLEEFAKVPRQAGRPVARVEGEEDE